MAPNLPCEDESAGLTEYHDVPSELAEEAMRHARRQADRPGQEPWPLDHWPDVPPRYLPCRDDRFFPAGSADLSDGSDYCAET